VATPDWLNVAARRTKCRTRHAEPFFNDPDPRVAGLARGVARHHADDAWFHESRAFTELSLGFSKQLRQAFGEASGMRPWFLGHILVELLLDDVLIAQQPARLEDYYAVIAELDGEFVAETIEQMTGRPVGELAKFIDRFGEIRFLADYADNDRLTFRLNQVLKRVGLAELPPAFPAQLPEMRRAVRERCHELTARPA
jgi:hypothetical protein